MAPGFRTIAQARGGCFGSTRFRNRGPVRPGRRPPRGCFTGPSARVAARSRELAMLNGVFAPRRALIWLGVYVDDCFSAGSAAAALSASLTAEALLSARWFRLEPRKEAAPAYSLLLVGVGVMLTDPARRRTSPQRNGTNTEIRCTAIRARAQAQAAKIRGVLNHPHRLCFDRYGRAMSNDLTTRQYSAAGGARQTLRLSSATTVRGRLTSPTPSTRVGLPLISRSQYGSTRWHGRLPLRGRRPPMVWRLYASPQTRYAMGVRNSRTARAVFSNLN